MIADLCQRAGIDKCYCLITNLEYPEWLEFMLQNKPSDCEIVNVGFGLEYLYENEDMIFPKGKKFQRWYNQVQHKNHSRYMEKHNLDIVVLGRRNIDGNICGKNGLKVNKNDKIVYSPIYDWSHELLFGYMHYNKIEIPKFYKQKRGFYNGTHLCAERKVDSLEQCYKEVYEIDPEVVINAAEKLPSAKKFLEEMINADNH